MSSLFLRLSAMINSPGIKIFGMLKRLIAINADSKLTCSERILAIAQFDLLKGRANNVAPERDMAHEGLSHLHYSSV